MKRIGIIGGGASGALAILHLHKRLGAQGKIHVFEPAAELGRGRAYASKETIDLLNVPAEKMSAWPDRQGDFAAWLRERHPDARSSKHWPFVPRAYFAEYLREMLALIPAAARPVHIRSEIHRVTRVPHGFRLRAKSGEAIDVDYLIIATGYRGSLARPFDVSSPLTEGRVLEPAEINGAKAGELAGTIAIMGTGLTAIDVWRRLRNNPAVSFEFLSRHGLFPIPHARSHVEAGVPALMGKSPLLILQILRSLEAAASSDGTAALADGVRAQAGKIWKAWSRRERAAFLRHMKPYWEIIRHRLPRTVEEELRADLEQGRARVRAGRIRDVREMGGALEIRYRDRATAREATLAADRIVLATGFRIDQSLVFDGVDAEGGPMACAHGFGYEGSAPPRMWVLGPASKGLNWEITAVPDIREQARGIALEIESAQESWRDLSF